MLDLLQSLNGTEKVGASKYQEYEISLKKRDVTVLIPLDESKSFETEYDNVLPMTTVALRTIVDKYNGKIE